VISYKDIALQIFSYSSQADYICYRVIAHFVPNFVAWQRGSVGENAIGSIQWPILETPLAIGAKISQIFFYISRVIAHFVLNFVAMATGVGRRIMQLATFDGPSPKTPL